MYRQKKRRRKNMSKQILEVFTKLDGGKVDCKSIFLFTFKSDFSLNCLSICLFDCLSNFLFDCILYFLSFCLFYCLVVFLYISLYVFLFD